jgi:hypothetical protein
MAKTAAQRNPSTLNLDPISQLVNMTIKTVMMKDISPKVNKLSGNVKRRSKPPTVALTKPISKPAKIAHPKLSTCTAESGKMSAAKKTANPESRVLIINLIIDKLRLMDNWCMLHSCLQHL